MNITLNTFLGIIKSNNIITQYEDFPELCEIMYQLDNTVDSHEYECLQYGWDELADDFNESEFSKEHGIKLPVFGD